MQTAKEWGIPPGDYYRLPRDDRAMMTAHIWVQNFQAGVRAYERQKEAEKRAKQGNGRRK
jgi:hypothetical protein